MMRRKRSSANQPRHKRGEDCRQDRQQINDPGKAENIGEPWFLRGEKTDAAGTGRDHIRKPYSTAKIITETISINWNVLL